MIKNIYERAKTSGCTLEATCVGVTFEQWEQLMKGHRKANQKKAVKIALLAGAIDDFQAKNELKKPWYNPYIHYVTKTHIIYVHSGIEHFIRVY